MAEEIQEAVQIIRVAYDGLAFYYGNIRINLITSIVISGNHTAAFLISIR